MLAKDELILINVHTPYEGEIAQTDLFIEYDLLKANEDKLPDEKDALIVIYCKSGDGTFHGFFLNHPYIHLDDAGWCGGELGEG